MEECEPRRHSNVIFTSDSVEINQIAGDAIVDDASPLVNSTRQSFVQSSVRMVRAATLNSIREIPSNDRNNSAVVAGWNISNLIQGIGILGIPFAFSHGSWAAIPVTVIIALTCCHTGNLLIECLYERCPRSGEMKRVSDSYGSIGNRVFPRFGGRLVTGVSMIEMFGGLILYIILLARMSTEIIQPLIPQLNIYYCSIITTYATMPLLFVTRLSIVSWFSLLAVLGLLSTIGTIIGYCLTQVASMSVSKMPDFNIEMFPISIGIIVFSYCAHAVFPSIEASMKKPEQFSCMLRVSFIIAAIVKVGMGLCAVFLYGMTTAQEVTANMASNREVSLTISIMVFINVFFSVPLVTFVITERIDNAVLPHFHPSFSPEGKLHWFWLTMTRMIILTAGLLIGMLVPHFALLMGLVGSFTGTCLCFLFPCYFHLVLRWKDLRWFIIAKDIAIILVGIAAGTLGIIFSAIELRNEFAKG